MRNAIPLQPEEEIKVTLPGMVKLMKWCWDYNPTKRPTCQEIQVYLTKIGGLDDRPSDLNGHLLQDVEKARSTVKIDYKLVDDVLRRVATTSNLPKCPTGKVKQEQLSIVDENDIEAIDRELVVLLKEQLDLFIKIKSAHPNLDCPAVNSMVPRGISIPILPLCCWSV
jgi:hypothetical protein